MMSSEELAKAYHTIVEKEASIVASSEIKEGEWYPIANPRYSLNKNDLKELLRAKGFNDPEKMIEALIKQGFLIRVPNRSEDSDSTKLRSLHMDVLVRSSQITTKYGRPPYALSCKFALLKSQIPSKKDRRIIPSETGDKYSSNLNNAIFSFFDNVDLAKTYISIIKDYLKDSGLDIYQSTVLRNMLQSEKSTHALIAPTGAGKTEIYLFYLLAKLIKFRIVEREKNKRVLLVYPRKTLTVDQAYRLIKLLRIANKYLKPYDITLTFAIRDGDTLKKLEDARGPFRGINCPNCENKTLIFSENGRIACENCKEKYEFVKTLRSETEKADIIATNPWALETRLLDSTTEDVNVRTLSNIGLIVFDEAHEYRGLGGGIISSLINIIKEMNSDNLDLVFSSATIPEPKTFISKLSRDNNCEIYDFDESIRRNLVGEKLTILSYLVMNPQYSWNTYCQLWSVLMAFLAYAYERCGIKQPPQSILFINNLKELKRVHSGYIENIRLGEPKDHLSNQLSSLEPYCYWHYLSAESREEVRERTLNGDLYEELEKRVCEMHSQLSKEERRELIRRLREGKGLVVLSTSSLELGVDYDGVSFVFNVGLDNPISLIQRVGRGGRRDKTMNTVLGIFLIRAIPTEMLRIYDENFIKALSKMSGESYSLFVTSDNPQIRKRAMLIESIARVAKKGLPTYASKGSKGPIKSERDLLAFIENILEEI
ncbi:MAG: DEAD/DEAH box helicase [Archaeoglobi archaeon]|nr:DEAD/DEAH box helicase [Archaeoglobi archaeon]